MSQRFVGRILWVEDVSPLNALDCLAPGILYQGGKFVVEDGSRIPGGHRTARQTCCRQVWYVAGTWLTFRSWISQHAGATLADG